MTPEELANLAHLRRARDLMDREYARPLDVPALAQAALMSPAHFSRQFRAAYGETPYNYLMTRRIERAKALLRRGDLSVTDVCMAVGCTSLGSFSSRFTEIVGETPTAYRARDHSAAATVPACVAKIHTRPSRIREATAPVVRSVAGMDISLGHCFITVHDADEALTFYRDALGLDVRNDVASEAGRWVTLSPPSQPDVEIVLSTPQSGRSPAGQRCSARAAHQGLAARRPVPYADLDTTFEKVRASGAEVLQEPTEQFWGAKDCAFRDPSGNMVRISQA